VTIYDLLDHLELPSMPNSL